MQRGRGEKGQRDIGEREGERQMEMEMVRWG
jgi:hypothetical protein